MVARKRKASDCDIDLTVDDPYAGWLPTVHAPNPTPYNNPSASCSAVSGYSKAGANGSYSNPIVIDSLRTTKSNPPVASYSVSSPHAASSSATVAKPPAKRQRKAKDPNAPVPEKRGAIFKKSCPKSILERVERAASQRIFLINRRRNQNKLKEEFDILGSTANVYLVTIDKRPSCTCPDFLKGHHCKHILFIFLKVLQVTQASGYWYQKALLTSELEDIFAHAPPAPEALANERTRAEFARLTGKTLSASQPIPQNQVSGGKKKIPGPEDDCPICYDSMHNEKEMLLVWCDKCGNALHKECFQKWSKASKGHATCVFCRSEWTVAGSRPVAGPSSGGGRTVRTAEGYMNLAGVAGLSPVRDTSTYYHGPRRGNRYYGYQEYDDDY